MQGYKIDFDAIPWESPMQGVRHKVATDGSLILRLVEYSSEMPPHWCEKAHYGYVLEGIFEIEFDNETFRYKKGDGLFLPAGKNHRHKARTITDKVLIIFIETQ